MVSGDVDTIYITAQEVYFALIDNNLVSLKEIEEQNTPNEAEIYSQFETKKAQTLSWLDSDLNLVTLLMENFQRNSSCISGIYMTF